jgi:RNase P subunit RPR2
MESVKIMICEKCQVELVPMETTFRYLERSFRPPVPRCPCCGQVYIPEELAKGQIRKVEAALEEK